MTTYNTGNPIGSTDARDLYDNAQNLDNFANGSAASYTDRLGVNRRTVEGINAAADVVLGGIGYEPPVAYAAGISMTLTTQTVEYSGEVYAPKVGNLPFTTSGTFETAKFRLIQGVSSADLPALVGQDLQDYAALRAYTGTAKRVYITGLLVTKKPAGIAGVFQHDPTDTTSADNGGTIIVGADGRLWKRDFDGAVHVKWFGAKGDWDGSTGTDDTAAIQAALDYVSVTTWKGSIVAGYARGGGSVDFGYGMYRVTDTLKVGANTTIYSSGPGGATAPSVTMHTGTEIVWDGGSGAMKWVISSATFNTADGSFAGPTVQYSGADHDSGVMTLTHGIRIRGITVNAGNAFGGIRLLSSSDSHVEDCMVYNCAAAYHFNTCYGLRYGNLRSVFGIYGCLVTQCTAVDGGHSYHDRNVGTTWTVNDNTRMVSTYDMNTMAFLPEDFTNKTYGFYCSNSIACDFSALTCEKSGIGAAFAHVSNLKLSGYFEGNIDSNLVFVATTGTVTALANSTTSGVKYHFGTLNDITLEGCSIGAIYSSAPGNNRVRVVGGDTAGGGTSDWTWSDNIVFAGLQNTLRVSATGSTTAVLGYTTFDEALRRIGASNSREWVIKIKDGDTVPTTSQRSLSDKSIKFEAETGSIKPTISVGAAGGGYIYRFAISGRMDVDFKNVNISFPTDVVSVGSDRGLFIVSGNNSANIRVNWRGGTLNLGNAYALHQVSGASALRVDAAWADAIITATSPGPLTSNDGGACLVTSIAASSVSVDAGIKSLSGTTNGWFGTVLSSNF